MQLITSLHPQQDALKIYEGTWSIGLAALDTLDIL